MDYLCLASELIAMRNSRPQIRFNQTFSKIMKHEVQILNYLMEHDTVVHPKDLSDAFVVSTARIAVVLNHLEQSGLIHRFPDARDNRQVIVTLSEKGVALLEESKKVLTDYVAKILQKMGEDDAAEYIRLQKKLLAVLAEV